MSDLAKDQAQVLFATQSVIESDPLYAWLCHQLEVVYSGMRPERVVLGHLDLNDHMAVMMSWPCKRWEAGEAQVLTIAIRQAAQRDADVRGRNDKYAVQMVWPTGDTANHLMWFEASRVKGGGLATTEPANSDGIVKQMMRHNETLMRMATGAAMQAIELQQDTIEKMADRIKQLEEGRYKVLDAAESLANAQFERENERARLQASETRKTLALQGMLEFTPLIRTKVIEWLTGTKMGMEHPLLGGLRALFDGMTVEQMEHILGTLPAAKRAMLLELYKSAMNIQTQPQPQEPAQSETIVTPAPSSSKEPETKH
jgi:hypothetical protein